jgi:hypothetical protein
MAGVFAREGEVLERIDGATCDRQVDIILHDISKDRNLVSKDAFGSVNQFSTEPRHPPLNDQSPL